MARREDGALVEHLGQQVRDRRLAARLTQEQLAERAGVRVQTVSNIENGRTQASLAVIKLLAQALGCSMGSLLDDEHVLSKPSTRPELSLRERELLDAWRRLSPQSQSAAIGVLVDLGVLAE